MPAFQNDILKQIILNVYKKLLERCGLVYLRTLTPPEHARETYRLNGKKKAESGKQGNGAIFGRLRFEAKLCWKRCAQKKKQIEQ